MGGDLPELEIEVDEDDARADDVRPGPATGQQRGAVHGQGGGADAALGREEGDHGARSGGGRTGSDRAGADEKRVHPRLELAAGESALDDVVGAGLEEGDPGLDVARRRNHQDRDGLVGARRAERSDGARSGQPLGDHEVDVALGERLDRLGRVGHLADILVGGGQRAAQRAAECFIRGADQDGWATRHGHLTGDGRAMGAQDSRRPRSANRAPARLGYTPPAPPTPGGSHVPTFLPHRFGACRKPRERSARPVRRYELMLLFQPDLEDDQLQAAVERVTRAIVNAGGSLSKISPWGKRRLAYPIQHHRDASYFLIHFDIEPSAVRDIERGLLISEEILRHLVVVLAPRQRRAADETADGAAGEADDALARLPEIDGTRRPSLTAPSGWARTRPVQHRRSA